MTNIPGRSGWNIVQRTEAMVKEKTTRMLKNIDDCLALRGAVQREKDRVERLEAAGFPALSAAVSGVDRNACDGGAMTGKKWNKKNKGRKFDLR